MTIGPYSRNSVRANIIVLLLEITDVQAPTNISEFRFTSLYPIALVSDLDSQLLFELVLEPFLHLLLCRVPMGLNPLLVLHMLSFHVLELVYVLFPLLPLLLLSHLPVGYLRYLVVRSMDHVSRMVPCISQLLLLLRSLLLAEHWQQYLSNHLDRKLS